MCSEEILLHFTLNNEISEDSVFVCGHPTVCMCRRRHRANWNNWPLTHFLVTFGADWSRSFCNRYLKNVCVSMHNFDLICIHSQYAILCFSSSISEVYTGAVVDRLLIELTVISSSSSLCEDNADVQDRTSQLKRSCYCCQRQMFVLLKVVFAVTCTIWHPAFI